MSEETKFVVPTVKFIKEEAKFVVPTVKVVETKTVVARVNYIKAPPTEYVVALVTKYVPERGPAAVIANSYSAQPPSELPEGAVRPEMHSDLLYLCQTCGQEGTIGKEWIDFVLFTGAVHCPACGKAMAEIPWSRKRQR